MSAYTSRRMMTDPICLKKTDEWEAWEKPSGWSIHNEEPSLLKFFTKLRPGTDFHFLNRLDSETSGIVLVTTQSGNVPLLQKIWGENSARKTYLGLHRRPRDFDFQPRSWSDPLTDVAEGRKNPLGLSQNRKPCLTHFYPVERNDYVVLSLMTIATGRQHQIRKHSALHRLELVGDSRYGDPKYRLKLLERYPDLRLGLHALRLNWEPFGVKQLVISQVPDFFATFFPDCRAKVQEACEALDEAALTVSQI